MHTRKTSVELMRFFAAAMVVFGHIRQHIYADNGLSEFVFIIVDFFFLLTGYFAMRDAMAAQTARSPLAAHDAVLFSWRKAKGVFSLYVFALAVMFIIRTALKDTFSLSETLKELFHFKWEFLMLHMAGFNHAPAFNVDYLLGPAWFISSLILALVPFYFLARRFGRTFSGVVAPICMVLIYAYVIQTYDTVDVGNQFVLGTMLGNFRAFAGLSAGAFVYHVNQWVCRSLAAGKGRTFLRVMDVIAWALSVSLFVFPEGVLPNADMVFWMVPFSFLVLNGVNDVGPVSRWLNSHGSALWGWLGRLSLYIYLLHVQIIAIWRAHVPIESPVLGSLVIFALVVVFSAVVMVVREGLGAARRKRAARRETP